MKNDKDGSRTYDAITTPWVVNKKLLLLSNDTDVGCRYGRCMDLGY